MTDTLLAGWIIANAKQFTGLDLEMEIYDGCREVFLMLECFSIYFVVSNCDARTKSMWFGRYIIAKSYNSPKLATRSDCPSVRVGGYCARGPSEYPMCLMTRI